MITWEPDRAYLSDWENPIIIPAWKIWDRKYVALWNQHGYVIDWRNEDDVILEIDPEVLHGTTPTYNGTTPTKADSADGQYYYTFAGWDPAVGKVVENVTYTATFTELLQQYQIYWWIWWNNWDQSRSQEYGSSIQPIETWNLQNDWYIFVWWYADKNLSRPFNFKNTIVTSDINIYAKWESCPKGTIVVNNKCKRE